MASIAKFWAHQFVDANGNAFAGVKVFHYVSGTSTDKDAWVDSGKSATAQQPVRGDSRGVVWFYGDGNYRLLVTTNDGIALYDWQDVDVLGRTTGTATRIPYFATGGALTEDDDLTWNETLKRLGVGTSTNLTERIVMPANSYLGAERSTASSGEGARKIIGLNASDQVTIDPDGQGIYLPNLPSSSIAYVDGSGLFKTLTLPSGYFIIGASGGVPVAAPITAGTGITVTNAPGGVTIGATGVTVYNRTATSLTINTSTTETSLYSFTIAASDLGTTKAMRVLIGGDYLNFRGGTSTLQIKILLGSTTIFDHTTGTFSNTANRRAFTMAFDLVNQNDSSKQFLYGKISFSGSNSATTGEGDLNTVDTVSSTIYGTALEVSTVGLLLDVHITHSNSHAQTEIKRAYANAILL